jgi:hypothetical protein
LALVATGARAADEVSVRAEVDAAKVGVQDQLQLTITLEGPSLDLAEDVAVPPLKNLRQVGGPFVSTQFSFDNGATSQSQTYTYVLKPVAPGPAEIGAARVTLRSGEKTTASIDVEVVPGSVRPRRAPSRPFGDPFGEDPFESLLGARRRRQPEPKLQVTAVASRARVHVGEPVLLTYFLDTQASVSDIQLAQAPQYPGFWVEDLEAPTSNSRGERATLEGEAYARFPIIRKLLFPTRAGSLTIPAAAFRIGLGRVSFFDAGPVALERSSAPVTIAVDPIPSEPGFSGAVGDFAVAASLDRNTVALGDAATLRFTIEGIGNLKWVDQAPEVTVPGAKVYPPQVKSDLKVGPNGFKGSKAWEFVVIPETSGALEIPPLLFSYFEPSAGVVKRAETTRLPLTVSGAGAASAAAPARAVEPTAGGLALRSDLDLPGRGLPEVGGKGVLVGLGLAAAFHVALAAASRLSDRRRMASGRSGARRSVRGAITQLERARRGGLTKEEAAALIERTLHAVFGPIEDGGTPAAGEREKAVRDVLKEVQFIRYAPQLGDYSEKIREVAGHAADVVRRWA